MTDSFWSIDTSTMFASDPLKPSPQRRINLKFISSHDGDVVPKSSFQLTSKKIGG